MMRPAPVPRPTDASDRRETRARAADRDAATAWTDRTTETPSPDRELADGEDSGRAYDSTVNRAADSSMAELEASAISIEDDETTLSTGQPLEEAAASSVHVSLSESRLLSSLPDFPQPPLEAPSASRQEDGRNRQPRQLEQASPMSTAEVVGSVTPDEGMAGPVPLSLSRASSDQQTPAKAESPSGPTALPNKRPNQLVKSIRDRKGDGPRWAHVGRYSVTRQIGSGAFGFVYEGYDPELHRKVAIKVARKEVAGHTPMRRLFEQEAEQASQLDHPRIVPIYELGLTDPAADPDGIARPYIVMGYCEGVTLDVWMKKNRERITPGLAADIVRQVAEGVGHGHRANVIHRDLKPGNVMVLGSDDVTTTGDDSITVRVLDFGLSGDLDGAMAATGARIVAGSAAYMSPEQADGDATSPTCDVHALGAVLFKLLTGRTPYSEGDGRTRLLSRLARATAPNPRTLDPSVPKDLAAICLKCLRKNPVERYANAAGLAADLQRYLAGETADARVMTAWEEFTHWLEQPGRIREAGAVLMGIHLFLPVWSIGGEFGLAMVDTSRNLVVMMKYLIFVTWPLHAFFFWVALAMFRGKQSRWQMHVAVDIAIIVTMLHFLRGIGTLPLPSEYYANNPGARWQVFWMLSLTAAVDAVSLLLALWADRKVRKRAAETKLALRKV